MFGISAIVAIVVPVVNTLNVVIAKEIRKNLPKDENHSKNVNVLNHEH